MSLSPSPCTVEGCDSPCQARGYCNRHYIRLRRNRPIEDLIPPVKPIEWMERGNCNGVDSDLFFPGLGASTKDAKAVCATCAVREECLEYALTEPMERWGIWGGTSERERRKLRMQRRWGVA